MDALSNLNSIRADVIEVWDPVTLQYKTIQETIVGLPPSTLNNLELIAAAIGNDRATLRPSRRAWTQRLRAPS